MISMDLTYTKIETKEGVATVTIMNPKANALSSECIAELCTLFEDLAKDLTIRAIVLTGGGKFFSAGADIKEFVQAIGDSETGLKMGQMGQALCDKVEAMTKPVIAAINGPALGGGLELAMSCHVRIAAHSALLGLPELKLGLLPTFGGTQRLSRIVGKGKALQLILSGRHVKAKEAQEIGLVEEVSDTPVQDAEKMALSFIEDKSDQSIFRTLLCITKGYDEDLETGLKREREQFADLFLTADAKEGIRAFIDKRSPNFTQE